MRNDYYSYSKDYLNRWVISYADFVTMLLALFMVMWALSSPDQTKIESANKNMQKVFTTQNTNDTKVKSNNNSIIQESTEQDLILKKLSENETLKTKTKLLKGDKGAIIRLNDKMLFSEGSAIIKPDVLGTLDSIASELKTLDNRILIEGHTDSTPINTAQFPSNWELSTARATNIISYLISKQGLSPQKMSAVGYGEYMPIAPNTSYEGKSQNRRVDIIILSSNQK